MYWVTHAATGAALGRYVQDPLAGLAAGLASHAALDMLPHCDYKCTLTGLADFGLGVLLLNACGLWAPGSPEYWAILGATIPDLEVALSQFGIISKDSLLFPTHSGLLPHRDAPHLAGALIQAALILLSLYLLE
ncbi:MAG: hypothetical protein ACM3X4_11160 [Ignavibacteriales bacterium]